VSAVHKQPKATRQRSAVQEALGSAGGFRSAQQLFDSLRSSGVQIGLTTVYRTLQSLTESGEVDCVRREDGESIYRRCDSEQHHHHLVCRVCGWSVEIENDEVERWAARAASKHGFSEVSHDIEVFGVCSDCGRS
jgi:Fur family ferric uptake transcriptional regulator